MERLGDQRPCPAHRRGDILDGQADGADTRTMGDLMRMGEAISVGVDDKIDRALRPALNELRLVHTGATEAHRLKQCAQPRTGLTVDGELDEFHPTATGARRQGRGRRQPGGDARGGELIAQQDQ